MGITFFTYYVIIYIQELQAIDGKATLAAAWPKGQLTYMTGSMEHLPNEMLIAWDNIAIAIQKIFCLGGLI